MRRVGSNDPAALREFGTRCHSEGDHVSAIEQWTKAAELGDADAHYQLFCVVKDTKKAINHAEQAAIGGHPGARYYLGCEESRNHRIERAVKHWIIAANLGHDDSLETLRKGYAVGSLSKEDFAAALRAHQAAGLKVRKERQPKEFLINVKKVRVRFAGSLGNMTSRAEQRTLEGGVPKTSTMPQAT